MVRSARSTEEKYAGTDEVSTLTDAKTKTERLFKNAI